ncbi:MAG: hypothetical protein QOC60_72 [Frankiaceae bacterium]|jgi:pimeloyl-ACP methyl ester carboxylesterase|nr:hypothetical protein [Frankiaceae bacterium]
MNKLFTRLVASARVRTAAILALAVSLPLALLVSGSPASGQPTTAHPRSGPRPTIVLVHGGWADSSGWNGEISRLVIPSHGRRVTSALNPSFPSASMIASKLITS